MPETISLAQPPRRVDWKRISFLFLGLLLFAGFFFAPPFPSVTDPGGQVFELSREGKAAIGLFFLASVWWVFEVVPIGITGILIGVVQALFLIRDPRTAFTDFMDPSVWFIIGSLVIGMVFSKTGLTQRMAYRMLILVGERTSMIYLGSLIMTAGMTLIMAHTAVAAAVYPLLRAIHSLYEERPGPTRFGKGLFIGMAFAAGAGSIVTLLGAARGAVAIGFFKDMVGREITFFELSKYMAPLGWLMVLLIWVFMLLVFKPERSTIPGLRERAKALYQRLGPMKANEKFVLAVTIGVVFLLSARSFFPIFAVLDKTSVILAGLLLFFVFKVMTVRDLEDLPWNIVLLFGGAMSIGLCLWKTGAASWLAVSWLGLLQNAPWLLFVIGIAFFVMIMTNFIMNVAAIAISLPVALAIAPYLGVAPEPVFYASLAAAGMPFMLLVGAAPNAIAYESRQFNPGEFFLAGIPMSILLMLVLILFVAVIWPLMGMPIHIMAVTAG